LWVWFFCLNLLKTKKMATSSCILMTNLERDQN
jgi:hypothetical protein